MNEITTGVEYAPMATAIFIYVESGDDHLFCVEDGFSSESLIKFLKDKMKDEFQYIEMLYIKGLNWDETTCDLHPVWYEISKELNKDTNAR